jgi:PAS domain S-box-containing protein
MAIKPSYEELALRVSQLERESTLQKKREKELRISEHRLNVLLQNTPIALVSWDLDFKVVEWNTAAEHVFGYSKQEAMGKHATELILPEEIKSKIDAVFRKLLAGKGGARSTNKNFTKKGESILCDWFNTPLQDLNGKTIGVASLVHDITHSKKAEEALKAREKEYRSTLNELVVGVIVHASDTSILMSNPEARSIIGLSDAQMSGKKAIDPAWNFINEDLTIMKVEDYPVSKVFSTQQALQNYVLGINRPDRDDVTWVMVNATPIFAGSGDLQKVIVNFVDITALKKSEQERINLEQQLRQSQKMEAIGTLAGGIAHDFNNLLAPILGYTQLAKLQLEPSGKEVEYLSKVEESANRAKELVNKILLMSRASIANTESVNLESLVEEVLTVIRVSIPTSINIYQHYDPKLPNICADASQIYQVILNLCTNAVQSMYGKGKLDISLTKSNELPESLKNHHEDFVCLSVRDTGCGMDPSTLARIYEPFFTTKEKGKQRGTGLGLSIVAGVVNQHKGCMEVTTEPGKGSNFKIYLPISEKQKQTQPAQVEQELVSGKAHILLIDDEVMLCELGSIMLEKLGYEVTACTDSREALRIFESKPLDFQLIITDYSMPAIDGPQLMQRIKAIRSDIPMLLVTGYSDKATPQNLESWGCQGIIAKPFDMKKFSQSVSETLVNSQ